MITRCKIYRTTTTSSRGGLSGKPSHAWWASVESTLGQWNYLVHSWAEGMQLVNRQLRTQHLEAFAKQTVGGYYKPSEGKFKR